MAEKVEFDIKLKDMMSGGLDSLSKKVDSLDSKIKEIGSIGKGAMGFVGGSMIMKGIEVAAQGIKWFTTGALEAYDKQEKAVAQVRQGIISTGGAAGLALKELQDEASGLQAKTIFGDEDILKDVTAQFLTFGNIQGDVFKRGQGLALDLATRLGGDLKGSAIQLGKALDNPIQGINALARSGVSFSESEKETIKSLVESGKIVEAQTMILNSLEKQYGGSAEAAREAGLGGMQAFKNSLGDIQEELGAGLMPMLNIGMNILNDKFLPLISKTVSNVGNLFGWIGTNFDKLKQVFAPLVDAIQPVFDAISEVAEKLGFANEQGSILTSVFNTLGSIIKFIAPLIKAMANLIKAMANLWANYLNELVDFAKFMVDNIFGPIAKFLNKLLPKKYQFENLDFGFKDYKKQEQDDTKGLGGVETSVGVGATGSATQQQSKVMKSEVDKIQSRQPSNVYINIDAIIKGDVNNIINNANNPTQDLNNFLVQLENSLLSVVNDVNLVLK